jgi:cytochrome c-type biogenesis protein CcmE
MERKYRFLIGGIVLASAIGFLIYTAVTETSVYYLTIGEFLTKKEALANEGVRVAGRVRDGSIEWNARTLDLQFAMADFEAQENSMPVRYNGILPDMFAEGRDVIVEGKYGNDGVFHAHTVLTSCPSKYEAEAPYEGASTSR